MRRIPLLLIILLMLLPLPALADVTDAALNALAGELLPEYALSGGCADDAAALLIAEDAQGTRYLFGCVKEGDAWVVTRSTPLPEGMSCRFNPDNPSGATLYFEHPALLDEASDRNDPGYADCRFRIALQGDGSWAIESVNAMHDYLYFAEGYVWSEFGRVCWGDFELSRSIAGVDWLTFPLNVQEAAVHMDAADRAILAAEAPLYTAPDGTAFARYNPGTPLLILDRRAGWYEVAILGGSITGWVEAGSLVIGAAQAEAKYLALIDLPDIDLSDLQKDAIPVRLHPEEEIVLTVLGGQRASLYVMGQWGDGSWLHVWNQAIPGEEGFVHADDLVPREDGNG